MLDNIKGLHEFSGIDITTIKDDDEYGSYEDINVILFIIDGVTYLAKEDPEDGYRSCCEDIEPSELSVKYKFSPIKVFCKQSEDEDDNIFEIIDCITAKPILKVGTDYSDDYYPCCIFDYQPGNMSVNQ